MNDLLAGLRYFPRIYDAFPPRYLVLFWISFPKGSFHLLFIGCSYINIQELPYGHSRRLSNLKIFANKKLLLGLDLLEQYKFLPQLTSHTSSATLTLFFSPITLSGLRKFYWQLLFLTNPSSHRTQSFPWSSDWGSTYRCRSNIFCVGWPVQRPSSRLTPQLQGS